MWRYWNRKKGEYIILTSIPTSILLLVAWIGMTFLIAIIQFQLKDL